ncbi:MAG: membrane protein of unknown function [Promethearchaeota archaeon]|nr:MAG: membrane protein of unknown function [Candidatus Lokiarchaeota archaeon]
MFNKNFTLILGTFKDYYSFINYQLSNRYYFGDKETMGFISGVKDLIKKPRFLLLILFFIILWILVLLGRIVFTIVIFKIAVVEITQVFIGFMIFLLIASFFRPLDEVNWKIIGFLLIVVMIFHFLIFRRFFSLFVSVFFNFSLIANIAITAFFAFKICLDISIRVDESLFEKEYNKLTRTLEFIVFGVINWGIYFLTRRFLVSQFPKSAQILFIIQWVNIILTAFVIVRLLLLQKLSAFITLFLSLASFYVIFLVFDRIAESLFTDTRAFFILSFIIDILLFIFIIGSLFDRVEYLQEKLKILKADTIALFIILMKSIVQLTYLLKNIPGIPYEFTPFEQELLLLPVFIGVTILFGLYSIFAYNPNNSPQIDKKGKNKKLD